MLKQKHVKNTAPQATKPLKVLVADDHYANRLLTQSLLQRCGHNITLTSDGLEALKACECIEFDLILLDIQMPIMDGIQALKNIRLLSNANAEAPTFALTAYSDKVETNEILAAGFQAVLKKPFRVQELMGHLDRPYKNTSEINNTKDDALGPATKLYNNVLEMPLLEIHTLDILIGAVGHKRMDKILKAYWKDADAMILEMKKTRFSSLENTEFELIKLRKIAHGLKGASANIGLLKASRLSAHLQNAPIENIPYLVETIERTLQESKIRLSEYCQTRHRKPKLRVMGS